MGIDDSDSFDAMLRMIAREARTAFERVDIDDVARAVGAETGHARELVDGAVGWLRDQAERLGEDQASWNRQPAASSTEEPSPSSTGGQSPTTAGPHPLDLPTPRQGTALAALDSGRWTVEPGGHLLVADGAGPRPADTIGIVDELRARDWLAADGTVTLTGRRALGRWLDASEPQ